MKNEDFFRNQQESAKQHLADGDPFIGPAQFTADGVRLVTADIKQHMAKLDSILKIPIENLPPEVVEALTIFGVSFAEAAEVFESAADTLLKHVGVR